MEKSRLDSDVTNPYVHAEKTIGGFTGVGWQKKYFLFFGLTCYFLSLSNMLDDGDGNDDCDDIKKKRKEHAVIIVAVVVVMMVVTVEW
jgi:hypothetical protein